MQILDLIVYIFSDIIFLHLWGWLINPIYRSIENSANTAIADSFLLLIELIFYGIVLALIIVFSEKIGRKLKQNKKDKAELQTVKKEEKPKKREYREYV